MDSTPEAPFGKPKGEPKSQPGFDPDGRYNSLPRPRPRFDLEVHAQPAEVLEALRVAVETSPLVHGLVLEADGKVEVMLTEDRVRFWSPQLSALVSASDRGTRLKARFGPHPHIWGLFLAGYALGVLLTCACLLFGLVQLFLDMTPWGLWLAPLALMITALTYGAAYVGQGLGAGQMHDLRKFLDHALEPFSRA